MIEFRCPFCAATVRVADHAAGQQGRCPRCATRIAIPRPAALAPTVAPATPGPPSGERPVPVPPASDEIVEFGSELGVLPSPGPTTRPPDSVALRAHRRRQRSGGWIVPLVLGTLLAGGVGWFAWSSLRPEPLQGELTATALTGVDLPPVVVPRDWLTIPDRQKSEVLGHLAEHAVPLSGNQAHVMLRGTEQGVQVTLTQGRQGRWYRIDPADHPPLARFVARERGVLDQPREAALKSAMAHFGTVYHAVLSGRTPTAALADFHESLGLNAMLGPLGANLLAVVGRKSYKAVAEDEEGRVYFLLPPDLKTFALEGRPQADGRVWLPAQYRVTVRESVAEKVTVEPEAGNATATEPAPPDDPVKPESMEPDGVP
jgi:DNA-directed RNA polymerase subunit RPC12/RpoP